MSEHDAALRAAIASLALAAIVANPKSIGDFDDFAREAVQYADALLRALEEPPR